jgi:ribosomal protein L34E
VALEDVGLRCLSRSIRRSAFARSPSRATSSSCISGLASCAGCREPRGFANARRPLPMKRLPTTVRNPSTPMRNIRPGSWLEAKTATTVTTPAIDATSRARVLMCLVACYVQSRDRLVDVLGPVAQAISRSGHRRAPMQARVVDAIVTPLKSTHAMSLLIRSRPESGTRFSRSRLQARSFGCPGGYGGAISPSMGGRFQ